MPEIPDVAVQAAMARKADLLSDCPSPTALSEETLTRLMLEAAADAMERSIRDTIAASLRRAAEGRREYAGPHDDGSETRPLLLKSAEHYESAALIIEDPRWVMGVIPSWRWTAEEDASIRTRPEVPGDRA